MKNQRAILEEVGEKLRLERIATEIRNMSMDNITKAKSGHPDHRAADEDLIINAAMKTKRIATVQDHYKNGGLNDAVLRAIAKHQLPVEFYSIALTGFGESGSPQDLYEKYGLSASKIIEQLGLTPKSEIGVVRAQ